MLKGIIFDLDDTLYNYKNNHIMAMKKIELYVKDNFNIDSKKFEKIFQVSKNEVKDRLNGKTASSHNRIIYFKKFLENINVKPFKYIDVLYNLYWNTILENMKLNEGVLELFEYLKKNNIKISICSNLTTHIQIRKINQLKIEKYVDYIITSEELGVEKPSSKMFQNVLDYFDFKSDEMLFIGDDYECDILGANNVGIKSILFGKPKDSYEHYNNYIESFNQLLEYLVNKNENFEF